MKTVRGDAFYSYYISYHYDQNGPIVHKSTSQIADIIFNVCMKFENYPKKTALGEAFYRYYILYHYFKNSKIRQKFKHCPIVEKSTSQVADIIHDVSMEFENYPRITVGEDAFYSYYILYHYFKISKFAKNSKIIRTSKKHKPGCWYHIWCQYGIWKLWKNNCRRRCIFSYYMLYHYFKISKIGQKFKNCPIVKKSTGQVADIIHNPSMDFEHYPRITVGEDAFFSYYMLYHYFKISKIRQKFKNCPIV